MLFAHGDWMDVGDVPTNRSPQPAKPGWSWRQRGSDYPVSGWYGLKKGLRGRFLRPPLRVPANWARPNRSTTMNLRRPR